jgi:WD40 repeat protein
VLRLIGLIVDKSVNKESDSTFVASACVSDSALLAVGYISGKVIIFSVHSGKILHILQSGDTTVRGGAMSLEISHNSRKVAMSTGQSSFKIWDLSNTLNPQTLGGHGSIASVAFSPDSQNLVSRSVIGETKIWDISGDDCFQTLDEHEGVVDILAFSHDSTWLASGDNDSTVKIWNLHGRCLQTLQGHSGGITRIDVLPSPARVGSLSWDQTYRIWDVVSGQCLQTYECGEYANLFTLSPDSRLLARRASNRTYNIWPIQLWDVVEDVCLLTWEVDSAASIYSFAFSSDSTQLAVLMNWSVIKIFHTGSGKCLQTLDPRYEIPGSPELAPGDGRYSVTFLKDATLLASAWSDGNIRIWDGNSGRCLHAVKTGPQFSNLTFDQSRCFLRTDHGRIAIPTSSELEDYMAALTTGFLIVHGVGVSLDGKWITYNSVNVLWLPLEYRPRRSAVSGNLIAIADGKKVRVFILYPDRLKYL